MVALQSLECTNIGSQSYEMIPSPEGWFIRTCDGESFGPFAALREVEDWLDAKDQQVRKPSPPQT